jgi:DNA-binding NarL/FixJ family response regulator
MDAHEPIERLIERSTFGTPAARRLRRRTSKEVAAAILRHVPVLPIRVLVCEDHPIFREGLIQVVQANSGMEIVAAVDSTQAAIALADRVLPDVVITDMRRSGLAGGPAIEVFLRIWRQAHVLVVSAGGDVHEVEQDAVEAGAIGVLTKGANEEEICEAIRRVARGLPAPPSLHVETSGLHRMRQTITHRTRT